VLRPRQLPAGQRQYATVDGDAISDAIRDAIGHANRDAVPDAVGDVIGHANGVAVGDTNGHATGHANGHANVAQPQQRPPLEQFGRDHRDGRAVRGGPGREHG
jgi:hypothetical protein